jgi:hypothetical protein
MSNDTISAVPNPGSIEARYRGCTCPVIDNHHGEGVPSTKGRTFWITEGCPVHNRTLATAIDNTFERGPS